MSFTYDPITMEDRDKVRLLVGDTDSLDPLLQDAEIEFLLEAEGGVTQAAIAACHAISARLGRDGDVRIDVISIKADRTPEHYLQIADRLKAKLSLGGLSIFAGGLTDESGNDTKPAFTRDLHAASGCTAGSTTAH